MRHSGTGAGNFGYQLFGGGQYFGNRAEPHQQSFGERLGVGATNGAKQQHFEQFIVRQRIGSIPKALFETITMSGIMRLVDLRRQLKCITETGQLNVTRLIPALCHPV